MMRLPPSPYTGSFRKRFLCAFMEKARLYLGSDASAHVGPHPVKFSLFVGEEGELGRVCRQACRSVSFPWA